jgi:surface protein
MSLLFDEMNFEGDVSEWDVSNVTNMSFMFSSSVFNGDISQWDVSKVKFKIDMFEGCSIKAKYIPKFRW